MMTDNTEKHARIYKYAIRLVLLIGILFRVIVFSVSPPNNAYDDHLEVVNLIAKHGFDRPAPFDCWECYQPPLYYYSGAVAFKLAESLGFDIDVRWKFVQAINLVLSILVVLIFYQILKEFSISDKYKLLYLSFIAILPRDIFTAAMSGNDYMLTFSAIAALLFYIKSLKQIQQGNAGKQGLKNFVLLLLFSLWGSLSKQHGILLFMLPFSIVGLYVLNKQKKWAFRVLTPLFLFTVIASFSEEAWKHSQTGHFLVSNQHYYDYADNQFPGSLDQVEFFSFKLMSIFDDHFISDETAVSFPTELFARTFFDYEWRFFSPQIPVTNLVGKTAYVIGVLWLIYFIWTTIQGSSIQLKRVAKGEVNYSMAIGYLVPFALVALYFAVPVIQTYRYPYFSSMKSMFMLPGIVIFIAMHSLLSKRIELSASFSALFTILNLAYGIFLTAVVYIFLEISVSHLYGPMWGGHML